MPFTVTMPKLSPTMEEGTIVKWHKKEGEKVASGEVIIEVATDKATVEHEALDEGWLRKILVGEGGTAVVNQAIAIFTESESESIEGYTPEGEAAKAVESEQPAEKEAERRAAPTEMGAGLAEPRMAPPPPQEEINFHRPREGERVHASPLARRLARERGLDLTTVVGTGPGGRIVESDLEKAQPAGIVAFGRADRPEVPSGSFEEEPLSPMRKIVGQRLQASKTFIPHFYVTQEIDAEPLMAVREQLRAYGNKLSVNDFIVRASALALRKHPEVNSGFNNVNRTLTRYKTIDICIAVSVEGGLVTPIIRYADYKNIGEISTEVRELAKRARQGKLSPEEYQGGSFTISNLGMYSISEFVAVINPPQAAILAIGGVSTQPVVRNGSVVPGKVMKITLSSDHRVIDGVAAAEFLQTMKEYLEKPAGLLVS
jgi:pyruvate dehydrogenase E2 component (dihydrolipoyllysine-residue acetyltransferase)